MQPREVLAADWVAAAAVLAAEGLDQLVAVQRKPELAPELWLRTAAGTVLWCATIEAPSLAGIWPLAARFEQAIQRGFGAGGELRKDIVLERRYDLPWPGAKDPSDQAGSPSRRKSLPLGVSAERMAAER